MKFEGESIVLNPVSGSVTWTETKVVFYSPQTDEGTLRAAQDIYGMEFVPTSIAREPVLIRHENDNPHPSHLAVRWEMKWGHTARAVASPVMVPPEVPEGPVSPRDNIDPFSL